MIKLKDRLELEQVSCQILYSYNYIEDNFEGWEKQRGFANWRVEILEYIMEAKSEHLNFICKYLSNEDSKVYLEFMTLASDYCKEPREDDLRSGRIHSIMNYIKKVIKPSKKEEYIKVAK